MLVYQGNPMDIKKPVWRVLNPGTITRRVFGNNREEPALTLEEFHRLRALVHEALNPVGLECPNETAPLP